MVSGGVAWTVLQALGTHLVHHFLRSASVYGVFATVPGLLAWIYLGVEITVYAAEINVVLARRLWPRSIVQPPLTRADRAVLAAQALQNQRRDDQHVVVSYDDRPAGAPRHPVRPRGPPMRSRRPRRPGRADVLTNALERIPSAPGRRLFSPRRWVAARAIFAVACSLHYQRHLSVIGLPFAHFPDWW